MAESAGEIESGPALVEEDEVLLGPVSPVCNHHIEVTITIKVANA
jgi:hypothetical protein